MMFRTDRSRSSRATMIVTNSNGEMRANDAPPPSSSRDALQASRDSGGTTPSSSTTALSSKIVIPSSAVAVALAVLVAMAEIHLVAVYGLQLFLEGLGRIEREYLRPHLVANRMTPSREQNEMTYYRRLCGPEDVSTVSARDLYLNVSSSSSGTAAETLSSFGNNDSRWPNNGSNLLAPAAALEVSENAYQTFLKHGAVVFPSVLSRDTASKLREFIIKKNLAQPPGEMEFLHSPKHRWVIEIGFDEDPIVAKALAEISSNPILRASLTKIFGSPDAALVELNAITSEYGCQNQSWHSDGTEDRSPLLYGRSFAPTHLMLTALQDTTPEMGGTALRPGTHYCYDYVVPDPEHQSNPEIYALTHPDLDYWPAGDGLLMTTNTHHRGTAFVDPHAEHQYRVVLVTTLSPVRENRGETRQLSQGLSYSLKPYMWGHTLNELARGIRRGWTDLTALGLYKRSGGPWGFDYITGFVQRMDGGDCCTLTQDSLHEYVKNKGGPSWLPAFLHGTYSLETSYDDGVTWYDYVVDSLRRCLEFVRGLHPKVATAYATVALLLLLYQCRTEEPSRALAAVATNRLLSSLLRVSYGYAILYALSLVIGSLVLDEAAWTRDIRQGRKDVVTFPPDHKATYEGPATIPVWSDVLIESRLGSRHLGMYADFLEYHPGNVRWREAVVSRLESGLTQYYRYRDLPPGLQRELARGIVRDLAEESSSRFLYQVPASGEWVVLDPTAAVSLTARELFLQSQPVLRALARELRFLRSVCLYGPLRSAALCQMWGGGSHILQALDALVLKPSALTSEAQARPSKVTMAGNAFLPRRARRQTPTTASLSTMNSAGRTVSSFPRSEVGVESCRKHWIPQEGDLVEALDGQLDVDEEDDGNGDRVTPAWWPGTVVSAHPLGHYQVKLAAYVEGSAKWYSRAVVCLPDDHACKEVAELSEGWSRADDGGYVKPDSDEDEDDDEDDDDGDDEDDGDQDEEGDDMGEEGAEDEKD